ncbi:MAG: hypothetical protein PF572_06345 [Patescibacteria group bacterium]|jgi:hypothetical protein|nr:hypothetical protein [Patescibacteria group bacterium]
MGINAEFNPDLCLRNISEYKTGKRKLEECIPENPQSGQIYKFLKKGQRFFWLDGEVPLLETRGDEQLSRPRAGIIITEATHFKLGKELHTKGKYKIIEVFKDNNIKFDGLYRTGTWK